MENAVRVTGLMSGSSLDGTDLALCEFRKEASGWKYRILAAETVPYPPALLQQLEEAHLLDPEGTGRLDTDLGSYYGQLLKDFHYRTGMKPELISSHGHTLLHEPDRGVTLQAGNGRVMCDMTGITVVNDFRREDVSQGGQGAPLVPVGDRLLFGQYGACLNLGGFANISFEKGGAGRIAYDLCPANMLLNRVAGLKGLPMDEGGMMARAGEADIGLLQAMNSLGYYSLDPPKSLGKEWFLEQIQPLLQQTEQGVENLMATSVEHVAVQIAAGIEASGSETVLVTGGGALNNRLIERIENYTTAELIVPDQLLVMFKEALIFALLGLLRLRGEINCLASVTGGKRDLSAGTIYRI